MPEFEVQLIVNLPGHGAKLVGQRLTATDAEQAAQLAKGQVIAVEIASVRRIGPMAGDVGNGFEVAPDGFLREKRVPGPPA